MNNQEVAAVFEDIAALLELKKENVFKVRAYQKAARAIENLSVAVVQLAQEGRLKEVPGIGEAISKKTTELVNTGRLKYYEDLKAEFPEGTTTLLQIPGVGPRTAVMLVNELKVKTVEDLEKAIIEGKVAQLPRMGDKTAENILQEIRNMRSKGKRIPIGQALPMVEEIIRQLKDVPGLKNLTPAGSLRRFNETVGDIDMMGTSDDPEAAIKAFTSLPIVKMVISSGTTKASILVPGDLQVDLRIVEHAAFGSLLQHFTGSKQHNINLRERARRQGLSISEYGITNIMTGNMEKFTTEETVYARVGLQYIPPELREGGEEIERAAQCAIPRLVEVNDIKGDLHIHTNWSDGHESIEEMVRAAKACGYEYVAVSDHSMGRGIAHGLDTARLREQSQEIQRLSDIIPGIHILTGVEVDIRSDGSLDLPDEVLQEVDVVLASIHSGMKESQEQMTDRMIKAMQNPHVDILAHPTGRLLQNRPPTAVDVEAIFRTALRTGTILEINAMPTRLDLKDIYVYRARELGIKLVIDTDAHNAQHLEFTRFGVGVARRGWCEAKDIVNTLPFAEFMAHIRAKSKITV